MRETATAVSLIAFPAASRGIRCTWAWTRADGARAGRRLGV